MKVELDGAQISALLGALDTERKSLVRAQAQKGKVQGLAEVYGHDKAHRAGFVRVAVAHRTIRLRTQETSHREQFS